MRSKAISSYKIDFSGSAQPFYARDQYGTSEYEKWITNRYFEMWMWRRSQWAIHGERNPCNAAGSRLRNVEQMFPFFGEIVNTMCGNSETAPVTAVFSSYVDLNSCIRSHVSNRPWTENELLSLEIQINSFRNGAKKRFGPYQALNMGTLAWHVVPHLVDVFTKWEALTTLTHIFLKAHIKDSKYSLETPHTKRQTAMSETLRQRLCITSGREVATEKMKQSNNKGCMNSAVEDKTVLVGAKKKPIFSHPRDVLKYEQASNKTQQLKETILPFVMQLSEILG